MYKHSLWGIVQMKKLFAFLFAILIVYVIYIDLTVGTLPNAYSQKAEAQTETVLKPLKGKSYFEEKVQPGETVISIVEHHINKPIPVSITDLVTDFAQLNPGQPPEKIRIGSTYKFPDYSKTN
jgi:hypothetical protein